MHRERHLQTQLPNNKNSGSRVLSPTRHCGNSTEDVFWSTRHAGDMKHTIVSGYTATERQPQDISQGVGYQINNERTLLNEWNPTNTPANLGKTM